MTFAAERLTYCSLYSLGQHLRAQGEAAAKRRRINCSVCAIDLAVRGTLAPPCSRGRAARDNCNPRGEGRAQLTEATYRSSLRRSSPGSSGTIHGLLLFTFSEIGFIARWTLCWRCSTLHRRSLCLFCVLVMSHITGFDHIQVVLTSTLGNWDLYSPAYVHIQYPTI